MLSKRNRLAKSSDFERVFKRSKPIATPNLSVRSMKRSGEVRIGFVISNKISKLSVRRNSLKRQLRKVVYDLISELKPGYDVIVVVRKDFNFPYQQAEIKNQIEESFKKIELLK